MMRKYIVLLALLAGLDRAAAWNASLGWNASSFSGTAGYNIYYGTVNGVYTGKVNVGNVTSATISNLTAGITYYFAATTLDSNGNESAFSNETSYIVPGILTMSGTAPGHIQFPVESSHWYEVQASTNLQSWATVWQTGVSTSNSWVQFNDPNTGAFSRRFYRLVLH